MNNEEIINKLQAASNGLSSVLNVQKSILEDIKDLLIELQNLSEKNYGKQDKNI